MKKNLLAKITLAVLVCASVVPAVASSHYKTLKVTPANGTLNPGQAVTDMGYRTRRRDNHHMSILAKTLRNTTKIDMMAVDSKGNTILDWKKINQYDYWQGWGLDPVDGVSIDAGTQIDVKLRNHYNSKKVAAVVQGEIDYDR